MSLEDTRDCTKHLLTNGHLEGIVVPGTLQTAHEAAVKETGCDGMETGCGGMETGCDGMEPQTGYDGMGSERLGMMEWDHKLGCDGMGS